MVESGPATSSGSIAEALLVLGIVVAFPFVFVAMVWLVFRIVALVGGWTALARTYADSDSARGVTGEHVPFAIVLRWTASYRGMVRMGATADGMVLRCLGGARLGHPHLLVPWADLRFTDRRFLWYRVIRFAGSPIPLKVSAATYDWLREAAARHGGEDGGPTVL